jgi:hypothetical protein
MKFERSVYPKLDPFYWSKGRAVAAKRRVNKELEKNALTPELARFTSVEQRRAFLEEHHDDHRWQHLRDNQAAAWRKGRRMLREAHPDVRAIVLERWNRDAYPLTGAMLCAAIQMHSRNFSAPLRKGLTTNPATT